MRAAMPQALLCLGNRCLGAQRHVAEGKTRSLFASRLFRSGWRNVREAGPQRLALTALLLVLAVLVGRFSWQTYFTDDAERALFDYRSYMLADAVEQDPRVVIVAYDDQTLINLQKRSPLDRGLLARALRNIDGMGARAIGIDILFDQPQAEDEELIATLRAMQTPVSIGYANTATNAQDIVYEQQAFLDGFMARLEGSNARPASIRLAAESRDVVRVWPDISPSLPPLLGRAMLASAGEPEARTFPGYEGAIRYRLPKLLDRPVFATLQIDAFANDELMAIPEVRQEFARQLEGAYILIGGDIIDYDRAQTPFSAYNPDTLASGAFDPRPPGIEIHATTIAQMLDGARLRQVSPFTLWAYAVLVVLCAGLTALMEIRSWRVVPLLLAQVAVFLGLPFWLMWRGTDTYGFPSVGPMLAWLLAFLAVTSAVRAASAVQRRFAQGALGKYLPASIAQEIIDKPELLQLGGTKAEIFVLFSDLEGFTKMSHAISPEMVAKLLNRYLDLLSEVVLEHGGILDKFVGDAVVAFWGAPIARPDDGERAAKCGFAIWQAGERFRAEVAAMDPNLPKVGKTRVGLHWGEAVVGNFGGENRIQYTALGDSMNTAARLESANKSLQSSVMASREFIERSGMDWWRPMGRVVLRGRAQPVDIFEPAPDFSKADREALTKAMDMLASNRDEALVLIGDVVRRNPADKALQNLLSRISELDGENAYVLD